MPHEYTSEYLYKRFVKVRCPTVVGRCLKESDTRFPSPLHNLSCVMAHNVRLWLYSHPIPKSSSRWRCKEEDTSLACSYSHPRPAGARPCAAQELSEKTHKPRWSHRCTGHRQALGSAQYALLPLSGNGVNVLAALGGGGPLVHRLVPQRRNSAPAGPAHCKFS